jgi:hypothetical protein
MEGLFLCADSHVVASDGIVTHGCKLNGLYSATGNASSFIIANASNDGNAATMVAKDILRELEKCCGDNWHIEAAVKQAMQDWHSGYKHTAPPSMQFILGAHCNQMLRRIYFCEPPNTVLPKQLGDWAVIGLGAQILDPLMPEVIRGPTRSREALLTAAYLMHRAKKDLVQLKGSYTDVLFMSSGGMIYPVTREEMEAAEAVGPEVDFMLRYCYLGMLGMPQGIDQRDFIKSFRKAYLEKQKLIDRITFPSLAELDKKESRE